VSDIALLLENNTAWSKARTAADPDFFTRLSTQQAPDYLWIGCSDSRVPANQIIGLDPGEVFVHRNIANVVPHADHNSHSVIQYAVEVLKVSDIIVCGHYGCGGVAAAKNGTRIGLIDNWLRYIQDVYARHRAEVDALPEEQALRRLCELNAITQAEHLTHTPIIRDAWERHDGPTVHAWIYGLDDGRIHPLHSFTPDTAATHARAGVV